MPVEKKGLALTSIEITRFDDWKIVLIENYPCNDTYELRARERYCIEQEPKCVNKMIPTRTNKNRELHKNKIQPQCKYYYLNT